MPAVLRAAPNMSVYSFSFWALFHCASDALENSPGERSLIQFHG
jgi:hypothetical protein